MIVGWRLVFRTFINRRTAGLEVEVTFTVGGGIDEHRVHIRGHTSYANAPGSTGNIVGNHIARTADDIAIIARVVHNVIAGDAFRRLKDAAPRFDDSVVYEMPTT